MRFPVNKCLFAGVPLSGLAAGIVLRVFDPATSGIFPPCPFHYLTGLYCPGCGSLRAIHHLLHGNLQAAWAMNPLAVLLLPFVGYGLAAEAFVQIWDKGLAAGSCRASGFGFLAQSLSGLESSGIFRFLPSICSRPGQCSTSEVDY